MPSAQFLLLAFLTAVDMAQKTLCSTRGGELDDTKLPTTEQ
jgi:hypothetical protein